MRKMVHRLIFICLIITAVSGLAFAEIKNEQKIRPEAYILKISGDSYIFISPLDSNQNVFITKRGTHKNAIIEGVPARIISQIIKIFGEEPEKNDKNIKKLVKRVISAKNKYFKDKNTLVINVNPKNIIKSIKRIGRR